MIIIKRAAPKAQQQQPQVFTKVKQAMGVWFGTGQGTARRSSPPPPSRGCNCGGRTR